ncbi:hypothetical protein MesoLjLc_51010 [Mesorhizobium sp. L-8-10]|uniref:helix-turn-helix domain-containing protein n=1 Tax=Mesorhizobium sp. L-8-10 TaxID=2744523 RepID=UPI001929114C|nr:helix-turn-helix domain-containing protein [Mesorhizobium sp. L-8-10]BCH33171.1 hypothetical protein MesoLjLc_51010 [Mesorhizobium sp. L-8-10]
MRWTDSPAEDRARSVLDLLADGTVRTADTLASSLAVSVRTIYRYMNLLQAAGEPIKGEAGVGYMLMRRRVGEQS